MVIEQTSDAVRIRRDPASPPLIEHKATHGERPYFHPLMAPDGIGVATEDKPAHHLWQHGLYFGLNEVNGFGFWTEGLSEPTKAKDGSIRCTGATIDPQRSSWTVASDWLSPTGQTLFADTVRTRATLEADAYALDITWTLRAVVDVRFGKYAYGGLFLRMPVYADRNAHLLTSEGLTKPADADGKSARWTAVSVRLLERASLSPDAQQVCIALMDHPSNDQHPVPWRTDAGYGIGPSRCVAGAWELKQGQSAVFRYRAAVCVGTPDANRLERQYQLYLGESL